MRTCAIDGCQKKYYSRDRCRAHYEQAWRKKELAPISHTTEERFWAKVEKTETCWNWTAALNGYGYGAFGIRHGHMTGAHRYSYELAHGSVDKNLVIDHICRNRACVRPDHLREVTQKQNLENQSGAYSTSRSGVRGVSWNAYARKWQAFVSHKKKNYFVGSFETLQQAEEAAIAKRLQLHTHNELDRHQQQGS